MERHLVGPYQINNIYTGDYLVLSKFLPDQSIDMILCDPVYWEYDQYKNLTEIAERVLKPGGNLVVQAGNQHLLRCIVVMQANADKMIMRPLLIETFSGGFYQNWNSRSLIGYHPYIWMTKGGEITRESWVRDTIKGSGRDKNNHEWGDSPSGFMNWIEDMTKPGDIILDPFTGGGTVPACAKVLGRNYIAFEIDEAIAASARVRIANTQPPLPLPEVIQIEMPL